MINKARRDIEQMEGGEEVQMEVQRFRYTKKNDALMKQRELKLQGFDIVQIRKKRESNNVIWIVIGRKRGGDNVSMWSKGGDSGKNEVGIYDGVLFNNEMDVSKTLWDYAEKFLGSKEAVEEKFVNELTDDREVFLDKDIEGNKECNKECNKDIGNKNNVNNGGISDTGDIRSENI